MQTELVPQELSYAIAVQRANFESQLELAQKYKRNMSFVQNRIFSLATLDTETADECVYALPRAGKTIEGASIRFAEIVKSAYGNCRVATQLLEVNIKQGYILAQAVFEDIEANTIEYETIRRRITSKNEDMINVHCNVALSIARRNVILKAIPRPLWNKAFQAVLKTRSGEQAPLEESRKKAIEAMLSLGLTEPQIFELLGVASIVEITEQDVQTMRGYYRGIKNGELTIEDLMPAAIVQAAAPVTNLVDMEEA